MALMEITYQYQYQGQEMINRWNYVSGGTPAAVTLAFALVEAFAGIVVANPDAPLRRVLGIQHTTVDPVLLAARDVYSNTDFYEFPFPSGWAGLRGGEAASPLLAWGFFTNRVRSDIRRGTKRIGGISETDLGVGGAIAPGSEGFINAVATSMSNVLEYDDEGNTITFSPAVVKKQRYVPDPLRPTQYAYRYIPEDEGGQAAQLADTVTGVLWTAYDRVRSQTSRQFGRGR